MAVTHIYTLGSILTLSWSVQVSEYTSSCKHLHIDQRLWEEPGGLGAGRNSSVWTKTVAAWLPRGCDARLASMDGRVDVTPLSHMQTCDKPGRASLLFSHPHEPVLCIYTIASEEMNGLFQWLPMICTFMLASHLNSEATWLFTQESSVRAPLYLGL